MKCPKCGATIKELGKCWVCGKVVTKEEIEVQNKIENSKTNSNKTNNNKTNNSKTINNKINNKINNNPKAVKKESNHREPEDFIDLEDAPYIATESSEELLSRANEVKAQKKGKKPRKKINASQKKRYIKWTIVGAAAIALAIVLVVSGILISRKMDKGYEEVLNKFYSAMNDADVQKATSLYDSGFMDEDMKDTFEGAFSMLQMIKSSGDIKVTYKINTADKLSKKEIKSEFKKYDKFLDEKYISKITVAVKCKVTYTTTMSYMGQSETDDATQTVLLYKKAGSWYMGPILDNQ